MTISDNLINILPDTINISDREELTKSISNIYNEIIDELFIIVHDVRRIPGKSFLTLDEVYGQDEQRKQLVNSVGVNNVLKFLDHDQHVLTYCTIFDAMMENIEKKIKEKNLWTPVLNKLFGNNNSPLDSIDIKYDDKHRVTLNTGTRHLTLIVTLLCLYDTDLATTFLKHVSESFTSILPESSSFKVDINSGCDVFSKSLYIIIHQIIHRCNNEYTRENVFNQFALTEVYLFAKALAYMSRFNGSNEFINGNLIRDSCDYKCLLSVDGTSIVFTNVILCSIYLWNSKYSWFKTNLFADYLSRYGNGMKTLAQCLMSRDKYNILYGLGFLYSIKFINISETNPYQGETLVMNSNKIDADLILSRNGALIITVIDRSSKVIRRVNLVVEVQSDHQIGKSPNTPMNLHSIPIESRGWSCVVYDIYSNNKYNVSRIFYLMSKLRELIQDIGSPDGTKVSPELDFDNKEIGYVDYSKDSNDISNGDSNDISNGDSNPTDMKIQGGKGKQSFSSSTDGTLNSLLNSVKCKFTSNMTIYFMYAILVVFIIVLIASTIYFKKANVAEVKQNVYDKSLL